MTTDIVLMGPHALASYTSRLQALQAYGISESSLIAMNTEPRSLAQISRAHRELVIQWEHHLMIV